MRLSFCVACGEQDPDVLEHHHLLPRAEGGSDEETNLITLCVGCHGIVHGTIRRPSAELQRLRAKAVRANRALHFGERPLTVSKRRGGKRQPQTQERMVERARVLGEMFDEIRAGGAISLRAIANEMNTRGLRKKTGTEWCHASVRALMIRVAKHSPDHPYEPAKPGGSQKPVKRQTPRARARPVSHVRP